MKIIPTLVLITSSWHLKFAPGRIQPSRINTSPTLCSVSETRRAWHSFTRERRELADETLVALAGWLNKIGRPAKTLEVLPQARASQRQDLFLHYLNALAALQRWNDIKDLFDQRTFPIEPVLQHMYLAVAQTHLGSATGATNEWQRALEVANTPEKLLALAKYAEQNSANDIADAAYAEAIKIAPKNREAYTGPIASCSGSGKDR